MAGSNAGKAIKNIEQYVSANLADNVAEATKGSGRAGKAATRTTRSKPESLSQFTAPELREMMLTPKGQKRLGSDTISPAEHRKVSAKLGAQNKLWQAQYEQMVFGKVLDKDAAKGFDPVRDRLPDPTAEEAPLKKGGNALYERPERVKEAISEKAEFEANATQSEDVSKTTRAVEDVTSARRRAERPLESELNRRDLRNPGPEEAEPEDIGEPLNRATRNWKKNEPKGSDVIAGGGDGSKGLPVAPRAAPKPQTKVENIDRDAEIDPGKTAKPTREYRGVRLPDGTTVKPKEVEGRSRNSRAVTSVGGTQSSPYLNKMVTDVVNQLRTSKYEAPYDFTYSLSGNDVEVKKGEVLNAAAIRHLMNTDAPLFRDFVGKGKKSYRNDSPRGDRTDAEARKASSIEAAGTDPVAPEVGMRLAPEDIANSEVATSNIPRMNGRPTQPATARIGGAQTDIIKSFGAPEYHRILNYIKNAGDDRFAYSLAYRSAEAAMRANVPGPRVSEVVNSDAVHGYAQALMAAAGRQVPNQLPASVLARDAEALASDAARGGLGSRPPARNGSETRWSEADEGFVDDPSPTKDFLRDSARARPFKPDGRPDLPKAGAPGKDDGIVLQGERQGPMPRGPEYRGTQGGKSIEKLEAEYNAGTLKPGDPGYDSIRDVIAQRDATRRDFPNWGEGGTTTGRSFEREAPKRNESLRRYNDPLEPDVTVEDGADGAPATWELGDENAQPTWLDRRFRGNREPRAGEAAQADDGLGDVPSEETLASAATGRQRKAGGEPDDVSARREAVRSGWSMDERASRRRDPGIAASELADDLSDYSTGQPTDAELAAIEAEGLQPAASGAARRGRKAVADATVASAGGDDALAPPPTIPPPSTVEPKSPPRTRAGRPQQPPPQLVTPGAGFGAASAAARRRAAAATPRPLDDWQVDAVNSPRAGGSDQASTYDPSVEQDWSGVREIGDPNAGTRALNSRRAAAARTASGWGSTFTPPPFRQDPLPAGPRPNGPDAPQGDVDWSVDDSAVPSGGASASQAAPSPGTTPGAAEPLPGLDGWQYTHSNVDPNDPFSVPPNFRAQAVPPRPKAPTPPLTGVQRALAAVRPYGRTAAVITGGIGIGGGVAAIMGRLHRQPPIPIPDFEDEPVVAPVSPQAVVAPVSGADLNSIRTIRELRAMRGERSRLGHPGSIYSD